MKFDSCRWAWVPAAPPRRTARRVAVLDEHQLHDAGLQTADRRVLSALGIRRVADPAFDTPVRCRRSVL